MNGFVISVGTHVESLTEKSRDDLKGITNAYLSGHIGIEIRSSADLEDCSCCDFTTLEEINVFEI